MATVPIDPIRTNYAFDDWFTEAVGGAKYDFSAPVTGNFPLYAKWNANTYTVTFYRNDGSETVHTAQPVAHNGMAAVPAVPTRTDGYIFEDWRTASTKGAKYDFSYPVTGNFALYARWADAYIVRFHLNDESTAAPIELAVRVNTAMTDPPPVPTREGYTFDGWFTQASGGSLFNFSVPITGDTVIYAHWTQIFYTVTFRFNYEGAPEPYLVSTPITHGSPVNRPANPTRTGGYTFDAWYKEAGCVNQWNFVTDTVTEALGLYAKWSINSYTVSFNTDGGSAVASQPVAHGSMATRPADPTRTGYTFDDWYTQATGGSLLNFSAPITGDTGIYARWTQIYYTVTFNMDGGTMTDPLTLQVPHGGTVTMPDPDPTRTGYTFAGWFTQATGGSLFNFSAAITGDTGIYARWTQSTYTVSFNLNYSEAFGVQTQTVTHGAMATAPNPPPQRTGYTLGGWFTEAACTTQWNFNNTIIANRTLYAKWTLNQYTVSFNTDGGSAVQSQTIAHGSVATRPANPAKAGYNFADWYTQATGGSLFNFSAAITGTTVIYARWTQITYTVSFNLNYSEAPAAQTQTVAHGATASAPTAPQRTGFTLANWFTEAACTTQWNFNNTITASRVLYAKWTQITYTVTFNLNYQGAPAGQTQNVAHGAMATAPTAPQRAGFTFGGWFTEAACTTQWNFNNTITATRIIYAKWTQILYTITMNKNGGFWEGGGQDTYANLTYGSTFTPPATIIKEGSSFQGWFTDAAMTAANKVNGSLTINGSTANLYAKWQTEPNMTVKFLFWKKSDPNDDDSYLGLNVYRIYSVQYNAKIPRPPDPPYFGSYDDPLPFSHWSLRNTVTPAWDFNTRINPTQSYWITSGGYYLKGNYAGFWDN
jgi:uncharacterized repeat protein (TIGR02543 family)